MYNVLKAASLIRAFVAKMTHEIEERDERHIPRKVIIKYGIISQQREDQQARKPVSKFWYSCLSVRIHERTSEWQVGLHKAEFPMRTPGASVNHELGALVQ